MACVGQRIQLHGPNAKMIQKDIDDENGRLAQKYGEDIIFLKVVEDGRMVYFCKPCSVKMNAIVDLEAHTNGKVHKKTCEKALLESRGGERLIEGRDDRTGEDTLQMSHNGDSDVATNISLKAKYHSAKRKQDAMAEETYEVVKSLKRTYEERDECQIFGDLVACKLRRLGSQQARSTVQNMIQNLLYNAEQGRLENPTASTNQSTSYTETQGCDKHERGCDSEARCGD